MCALAAPCPLPLAVRLLGREGTGALPGPGVGAAGDHGLTAFRQPFYSMCLLRDLQSTYSVPGEWLGVNQAAHGTRKTVPAGGGRGRASTEHAHSSWPCSPSIPRIRPIPAATRSASGRASPQPEHSLSFPPFRKLPNKSDPLPLPDLRFIPPQGGLNQN